MLRECVDVFQALFDVQGMNLFRDVPLKDGTYYFYQDGNWLSFTNVKITKGPQKGLYDVQGDVSISSDAYEKVSFLSELSGQISANKGYDSRRKNVLSYHSYAFCVSGTWLYGKQGGQSILRPLDELVSDVTAYFSKMKCPVTEEDPVMVQRLYQSFLEKFGNPDEQQIDCFSEAVIDKLTQVYPSLPLDLNDSSFKGNYCMGFYMDGPEDQWFLERNRYWAIAAFTSKTTLQLLDGEVKGLNPWVTVDAVNAPYSHYHGDRPMSVPDLSCYEDAYSILLFLRYLRVHTGVVGWAYVSMKPEDRGTVESVRILSGPDEKIPGAFGYKFTVESDTKVGTYLSDWEWMGASREKWSLELINFWKTPLSELISKTSDALEYYQNLDKLYQVYFSRDQIASIFLKEFFGLVLSDVYASTESVRRKFEHLNCSRKLMPLFLMYQQLLKHWITDGYATDLSIILYQVLYPAFWIHVGSNDSPVKVLHQIQLIFSIEKEIEGGCEMADLLRSMHDKLAAKVLVKDDVQVCDDDREYYFALGQLVDYLQQLSESRQRRQDIVSQFVSLKDDVQVKNRVSMLYQKYSHTIPVDHLCFNNLMAMVMGYVPEQVMMKDAFILGYVTPCVVFQKVRGNSDDDKTGMGGTES